MLSENICAHIIHIVICVHMWYTYWYVCVPHLHRTCVHMIYVHTSWYVRVPHLQHHELTSNLNIWQSPQNITNSKAKIISSTPRVIKMPRTPWIIQPSRTSRDIKMTRTSHLHMCGMHQSSRCVEFHTRTCVCVWGHVCVWVIYMCTMFSWKLSSRCVACMYLDVWDVCSLSHISRCVGCMFSLSPSSRCVGCMFSGKPSSRCVGCMTDVWDVRYTIQGYTYTGAR